MIKNIKSILKTSALLFAGSFVLWSCESEVDNLGSQFFDGNTASGTNASYDVVAYNINNNDTVRADATKLTYATLGAFTESQFGMQKSNFVSQVRLSSYAPTFGTNAVVDSVVLEIKPLVATATDSVSTTTDENYVYPIGNVEAKKVVTTYPITKYGKSSSTMTLNVYEVDDFLGSSSDAVYSNKTVNVGTLLGTQTISNSVSSVVITKDSDNTELLNRGATIRIPLDKTFFQNKIIDKQGSQELSDVSNFIRYFKGIKVNILENDGYIFSFTPNDTTIKIYYTKDVTSDGTTTATADNFSITLGSGNARYNQIEYNRTGTPVADILAQTTPNYQNGDTKLYAQGMGGPRIGLRIPAETVAEIRDLYKNQNIGIVSAKIRLYSDASVWDNNYAKPTSFTAGTYSPANNTMNLSTFLQDFTAFAASGLYSLVTAYDLTSNPAYYDISITQTFKNIIEKSADNEDLVLTVGGYELNTTTGAYLGATYTSNAYTPNRIVLVGTDSSNDNRAKLNIIYATK
ncbi:MAG: DUF4270 domain-containing protein [Cruoricaptor ignavus]|nr:DUF4270 domain-containing protein [Cruoricaptor ignavus]